VAGQRLLGQQLAGGVPMMPWALQTTLVEVVPSNLLEAPLKRAAPRALLKTLVALLLNSA